MRSKARREARLAVAASVEYKRILKELPMCVATNSNRDSFPAESGFETAPVKVARPSQAPSNDANICPPRTLMFRNARPTDNLKPTRPVEHTKREPIVARLSFRRRRGARLGVCRVRSGRATRAIAAPGLRDEAVRRDRYGHRRQVRDGAHTWRRIRDGLSRRRGQAERGRRPPARGQNRPVLDGQARGDLGRIRPVRLLSGPEEEEARRR